MTSAFPPPARRAVLLSLILLLPQAPKLPAAQTPGDRQTYQDAIAVLRADLETDPDDAEAWFGLSIAHMFLDQIPEALEATTRAAAIDASDPRFTDQMGEALMLVGRPDEAIDAFERTVDLDPRLFFPRLRLGQLYLEIGGNLPAIAHLEEAVVLSGLDADARRLLGLAYFRDGQLERAIAEYRRAMFLAPDDPLIYLETAEVFFAAGLAGDVEATLSTAVARFPDLGQPHLGLARLFMDRRELERAREQFELALATGDAALPLVTIHRNLGDIAFDLGEFDPAIEHYDRALEVEPQNVDVLVTKADRYLSRDRIDEARTDFEEALRIAPDTAEAHYGIAAIATRSNDFEGTVDAARRALELDPSAREARYLLGRALLRLGDNDEGRRQMDIFQREEAEAAAEEQRTREWQALNQEALTLLADGRNQEAIGRLEDAVSRHPDQRTLYTNLAAAQSQSGLHADAAETFLRVIERDLGDALTHLRLSWEYERLGDADAAARHEAIYVEQREAEQETGN